MKLEGFNTPESEYWLDRLMNTGENSRQWTETVSRVRQLQQRGDTLRYTLPGLFLCWKCTVKHVGQAMGFAAELESYPERIVCVIGELGHAYRECPDKEVAKTIRAAYLRILDTGCVEDYTELLKVVSEGWLDSLQDDK